MQQFGIQQYSAPSFNNMVSFFFDDIFILSVHCVQWNSICFSFHFIFCSFALLFGYSCAYSIIFILRILLQQQQFGNGYDNNGSIGNSNDMVSFKLHECAAFQCSFYYIFFIFYSLNQHWKWSRAIGC